MPQTLRHASALAAHFDVAFGFDESVVPEFCVKMYRWHDEGKERGRLAETANACAPRSLTPL